MIVTRENYYDKETNQEYFSNSQFSDFEKCEAYAMAKIFGYKKKIDGKEETIYWEDKKVGAMIQGQYVHAWNEGRLDQFKASNPDLYKEGGTLYAKYADMENIIDVIKNDKVFMDSLSGEKEKVFTAEWLGVKWKILIDSYMKERKRFSDLKVLASLDTKEWNNELSIYESVFEYYKYFRQVSLYAKIEALSNGRDEEDYYEPLISVVTKQKYPDKVIVSFKSDQYGTSKEDIDRTLKEFVEYQLRVVKHKLPRYKDVKEGREKPIRCEECDYCRATKKVTGTTLYTRWQLYGGA